VKTPELSDRIQRLLCREHGSYPLGLAWRCHVTSTCDKELANRLRVKEIIAVQKPGIEPV
jgi:hypothetical protein